MNINAMNDKLNSWIFGAKDRIEIYNMIAEMLENGISLPNAVEKFTLGKQRFGMEKDASTFVMKKVYLRLSSGDGGVMLSRALRKEIPEDEFMILFSAEENGLLINGLRDAVYLLETKKMISSTIKEALIVPVILVLLVVVMMAILQFKVMPIIADVLEPSKWPTIAINLNAASHFVIYDGIFILGLCCLILFVFNKSAPVYTHYKIRPILDKLPLYSHYKQMQGTSFLMSVSAMLSGGTALSKTLKTLNDYASPYMRVFIRRSINIQSRGGETGSNGECLNNNLFNKSVSFGIYIYGDLEDFQKSLYVISKKSTKDLLAGITTLMTVIRNTALVTLLAIVVSIISMISGLTAAMQTASSM